MDHYIGPEKIIEKKKDYLYPCSHHFYKYPPQIVKGDMQYLYDEDGKRYLDFFAGVSVMNCGHCNPEILKTTIEQLSTLQHTTTIYLTQPIVDLAEKMATILPGELKRSFFCCTGSEANEGALLLARLHTGKKKFITLEKSLHGRTHLTMSATAIPMWRADPYLSSEVLTAPGIDPLDLENSAKSSLKAIESILAEDDDIAALIIEPIQGNGGIITPPDWYFKELYHLIHQHDALLIVDEVQTGFARTGRMFAIENFEVIPDIMTMAKALGNGIPISAFCTTDAIASSFTKPSASTLGGNPVASKTALAVLDYIERNDLSTAARELGHLLKDGLLTLKEKHSLIEDVRGIGLMLGAELIREDGTPASEETDAILEYMKDHGILIGKNGLCRNVLAFQPPLIVTEEDVNTVLENLDHAFSELEK
ncbi:aspartate aminotransferase family protein [Vallitalea okinawensis]|uniref:aspartate aminotransferase family protein n=1 Tax=Vallitalea okinawensis TaxID=2078660 RepID=UPI000CFC805D|nr:aspartate aminotransferase family protein [Vallitalea okinawensis]